MHIIERNAVRQGHAVHQIMMHMGVFLLFGVCRNGVGIDIDNGAMAPRGHRMSAVKRHSRFFFGFSAGGIKRIAVVIDMAAWAQTLPQVFVVDGEHVGFGFIEHHQTRGEMTRHGFSMNHLWFVEERSGAVQPTGLLRILVGVLGEQGGNSAVDNHESGLHIVV